MKRNLNDESSDSSTKKRKIDDKLLQTENEETESKQLSMAIEDDEVSIGELWNNGYNEPDYRPSLIYAIESKDNWKSKILNAQILEKWKKEAMKQGMSSDQFDATIRIMEQMSDKDKKYAKLRKNQYYSSDSDASIGNKETMKPTDYGVIEVCESEWIGTEIGDKLREYVQTQIEDKLKENEKDWHPKSNKTVLDLVHPSLYCYVANESVLIESTLNSKLRSFIAEQDKAAKNEKQSRNWFYVRPIGSNFVLDDRYKYQWMPSEFEIVRGSDGKHVEKVNILSYINNLDRLKHSKLYDLIADIFKKFVPLFDKICRHPLNEKCQVIVKLANILLDESHNEYDGGVWHLEGMKYEHIACSGIYYYEIDNVKGSYLQFRRSIDESGIYYEQNDNIGVFEQYGMRNEDPLNEYLGKIAIDKPKCIAFSNNMQHRVTKFKKRNDKKCAKRKILVFFVVDNEHKIVSTENVSFQQLDIMKNYLRNILKNQMTKSIVDVIAEYMPCFDMKTARQNREKLMFVRKYIVKEQNEEIFEMPFSLCEH